MNMRTSVLVSVFVIAIAAIVTYRETTKVGQGLIAEDLLQTIPAVLNDLYAQIVRSSTQ